MLSFWTAQFQSTLPARGATRVADGCPCNPKDFNPRSPHGERPFLMLLMLDCNNFNPRSPHGERLVVGTAVNTAMLISIHAPRTGSDMFCGQPRGEVRISIHAPRTGSDHGGEPASAGSRNFNPRSPHGERPYTSSARQASADFNPRSPHGERRNPSDKVHTL